MPETLLGDVVGLCSPRCFLPGPPVRLTVGVEIRSLATKGKIQQESPPVREPENLEGLWDSRFSRPGWPEGETHVQGLVQSSRCDQGAHFLRCVCVSPKPNDDPPTGGG